MRKHMQKLKKILGYLFVSIAIAGCVGNAPFKQARENAYLVKNGMTVAEATHVLGIPPTLLQGQYIYWQTHDVKEYYGNIRGAIRFEVADGRIVNIPPGGIFSSAAEQQVNDAWVAAHNRGVLAATPSAPVDQEAERAKRKAAEDEIAQKRLEEEAIIIKEMAREAAAANAAAIQCADKLMCSKVFALSQIYVTKHSDQKIQIATDTIIETYNPTDPGKIGISVIKTPRQGTAEVVALSVSCKDSEYGNLASFCRRKRTDVYAGFKPFVESLLMK
jgi:hypothetical protein